MAILYKKGGSCNCGGVLKKKGGSLNFKSKGAYNKWLAYGHASGEFEKTPGHQKVSIKGTKKKVKH